MQALSTNQTRSRPNPAFFIGAISGTILASGCVIGPPSIVQVQPAAWKTAIQKDASAKIRVTTFNVWGLPTWLNGASGDRYARMATELNELSSDVVLLQEVWTKRCFAELSEESKGSGRTWWAASARHKGTFLGQNGLLTLSRYPIVGTEVRHFGSAGLPDSLMHKGALKVTVEVGSGQRYNIWNVHLQDGGAQRVRSRQLAELIQWVDQANDGQVADVVGGDFNFTPDTRDFSQFVSAVGPDIHQLAGDSAFPTWDALKAIPGAGQALDHIFVRLRRTGDEADARPRRVFSAARRRDRLSDHMGLEALITFGGTTARRGPALVEQGAEAQLASAPVFQR